MLSKSDLEKLSLEALYELAKSCEDENPENLSVEMYEYVLKLIRNPERKPKTVSQRINSLYLRLNKGNPNHDESSEDVKKRN